MTNKVPSTLDRVQAARLAAIVRESIRQLQGTVLESHGNEPAAQEVLNQMAQEFMRGLKEKGVLEHYEVVCDATNNTPERVSQGRLVVDILFQTPPFKGLSEYQIASVGKEEGVLKGPAVKEHDPEFPYFTDSEEYPQDIVENPLPMGVHQVYVPNSYLDGFINQVSILKAFVLERYTAWEDDPEVTVKVQDPPNSFNWVDFKPTTKEELFQRLTVPGAMMHCKALDFRDDVLILGRARSGANVYMFFWYDCDVSDCSICRFETDDPQEVVVEAFAKYVLNKTGMSHQNRHREIPLHYFQGWISS